MNAFTNLPRNLRIFFSILRVVILVCGVFWALNVSFGLLMKKQFQRAGYPSIITVGEVTFAESHQSVPKAFAGPMRVVAGRGTLEIDMMSDDAELVSAVRWATYPSMVAWVVFSYLLVLYLRALCGNLEAGEAFSENNLRLVRKIGTVLVLSSLAGFGIGLWASSVMDTYLNQHAVALAGIKATLQPSPGGGTFQFSPFLGQFPGWGGLISGCVVLMISEAFRQGLKLKAENDLTV